MLKIIEHSSDEEPFGGYTTFMLMKHGRVHRQFNIINIALKLPGVRFGILRYLLRG